MAWIVKPRQIADENGLATGKWRMTACSDEDGGGPYGCLECSHATPEEAKACGKCEAAISRITGFPTQRYLRDSETLARAWEDLGKERLRQIDGEGFSQERDDGYHNGELVRAALCYLLASVEPTANMYAWLARWWRWGSEWWKPTTPRRNLVKAGALILAEIERLDRASAHPEK